MAAPSGLLVVDKPGGMTSHDAVAHVRRALSRAAGERVAAGHTGTLDPAATGVLLVLCGSATRLAPFYVGCEKRYDAAIQLGAATDTQDASGNVVASAPFAHVDREAMAAAAGSVRGVREQVPPMWSAVKVGGKRLYDLARQGREVERRARPIEVFEIALTGFDAGTGRASVRLTVSSGTYVRTLADEIGKAAGTVAHLHALRRLSVGNVGLDASASLPLPDDPLSLIVPRRALLTDIPAVILSAEGQQAVKHGRPVPLGSSPPLPRLRILSLDGELVAMGEAREQQVWPRVVFP
ncbi:MAG: tRNA pseudouridine(55) synthase TruB [Acidobacteriota bacterium]